MLASNVTNYSLAQKYGYQRNPRNVGMTLLFTILTKNASFRSYAYLLRAHISNINMRRYITSVREHELSGRVRAHAMPGLNARGLQSKLLITPLSE